MSEKKVRDELDAVYASTSWKITAPIRAIGMVLGLVRRKMFRPKKVLVTVIRRLANRQIIRSVAQRVFLRFPRLEMRVRNLIISAGSGPDVAKQFASPNMYSEKKLTPAASIILRRLRVTIHTSK